MALDGCDFVFQALALTGGKRTLFLGLQLFPAYPSPLSSQDSSRARICSLWPRSQYFFYLCQQLGATFCQILLAHLISKHPKSGFHGQSPACSKGWEQVSATLVTFHLSSFLLFLLYSCPMASWSPCDPSQTFRPTLDISHLGLLCLLPSSPVGCYLLNSLNFQESKGPHRQNLSWGPS